MSSVAVVLPARLETRFRSPSREAGRDGEDDWELHLAVVPAEPWFDRHDRRVSADERRLVDDALAICGGDPFAATLDTEATSSAQVAFEQLAGQVGAGRAAWLLREGTRVGEDGRREAAEERAPGSPVAPAVLRGLPAELEVWAELDGDPPRTVRIGTLAPQPELPVEPWQAPDGSPTFWADHESLQRAGLCGVIMLADADLDGGPIDPAAIRSVTVVGLGDTDPGALLTAHAHAGQTSLLPPGTPTNVTPEAAHPAATSRDWHAAVRAKVAGSPEAADGPAVSFALTGDAAALPAVPGWATDTTSVQRDLVTALWPALWGHSMQELWNDGTRVAEATAASQWWQHWVRPQGPFPSLLVGDQPYGLLPVTPLTGDWAGALQASDPLEERLARAVDHLLAESADRAERRVGTVMGAEARQVERVLRATPTSDAYAYRWTVCARNAGAALQERHARAAAHVLDPLEVDARNALAAQLAVAGARPVTVPLVEVDRVQDELLPRLEALLDELQREGAPGIDTLDPDRALGPDAWRLALRALAWRMWAAMPDAGWSGTDLAEELQRLQDFDRQHWPRSVLVRLAVVSLSLAWRVGRSLDAGSTSLPGRLDTSLGQWDQGIGDASPVVRWWQSAADALDRLAAYPGTVGALERTLSAVLDSAVHRVDPLITAVATARLDALGGAPRRLGLYGWIDRPFTGYPGFTDRGVLLAPSPDQAATAAILRDRFAAHAASGENPTDAWDLTLDSGAVRTATGVLDDIRAGVHPAEAIGRLVEQVLPMAAHVSAVRSAYPQDLASPARHTCDGLRAGDDLVDDGAAFTAATGLDADIVGPTAWSWLLRVGQVVDTAADLMLAESVYSAVTGATAQLSATLEAAPGLAVPPTLRAQATPTQGTTVSTRVLLGLPAPIAQDVPGPESFSPADADPAVKAVLDGLGDPADSTRFALQVGGSSTTLAALGLRVSDLVVVDDAALATLVAPGPDDVELTTGPGIRAARLLLATLRRTRPVADTPAVVAELRQRLGRVRDAATLLCDDIEAAGGTQAPELRARLLRWGVAGDVPAAVSRLRAALSATDLIHDHDEGSNTADQGVALARAVQRLAGSGAGSEDPGADPAVPVLLPWDGGPTAPLADTSWLPMVRRVRPAVDTVAGAAANLAEQLGTAPLEWSATTPGDPWRGTPEGGTAARFRTSTVMLAPATGAPLVVGEVDAWSELVPGVLNTDDGTWVPAPVPATLAVGFNAPATRAPQAILLAVPPADDVLLDVNLVRACVAETRLLARVRTLERRHLGPLGAVLPSALLPAADRWAGVVLNDEADVRAATDDTWAHVRLEQAVPEGELARGLRAETADPLWLLARQWQVGESQGENASHPVEVRATVRRTPLRAPSDRPFADPSTWPGEAVLEAATEDQPGGPPGADPYDTTTTRHTVTLPTGGAELVAAGHDGGAADWWSVDAEGRRLDGPTRSVTVVPGQLSYPGSPAPGWFTLESPDETVTAHVPDAAHVPSLFLLDLLAGHSPDWYLAELPTPPGHVLTVESLTVVDTFGEHFHFSEEQWESLDVDGWDAYRTTGLQARDLLVWAATPTPLEGPALEQVLLGVDEDANLLWVVQQVVDGKPVEDIREPYRGLQDQPLTTPTVAFRTVGPAPHGWHPYPATDTTGVDAQRRRYRQGRLLTLDGNTERLAPPVDDGTRLLRPGGSTVHHVEPTAIPATGITLERRWVLARATDGQPVMWQQRRRRATTAPPAHDTAFDRSRPNVPLLQQRSARP